MSTLARVALLALLVLGGVGIAQDLAPPGGARCRGGEVDR